MAAPQRLGESYAKPVALCQLVEKTWILRWGCVSNFGLNWRLSEEKRSQALHGGWMASNNVQSSKFVGCTSTARLAVQECRRVVVGMSGLQLLVSVYHHSGA